MNLIEFFVCLPDKCDEQDLFYEENIWYESIWQSDINTTNKSHDVVVWSTPLHSKSDKIKLELRYNAENNVS